MGGISYERLDQANSSTVYRFPLPESDIVLIGGSAVYGNLTTESDIDLIMIDESQTPRIECYHFLGWKIEAFIYTALSLELEFQTARYNRDAHHN